MMSPTVMLSCLAGAALAAIFFLGLQLTVKRVAHVARPGALVLVSMLARMLVALAGFYLIARLAGGAGLIGALVTFLVVRSVLIVQARRGLRAGEKR